MFKRKESQLDQQLKQFREQFAKVQKQLDAANEKVFDAEQCTRDLEKENKEMFKKLSQARGSINNESVASAAKIRSRSPSQE